jgi:hypothetical protein
LAANVITAAATASDFGTEVGTAVWATTTRLLTAGTNIALAKGTGVTGFNDLSAAQVNAEVDTALADYDGPTNAELTTVGDKVDDIHKIHGLDLSNPMTVTPTSREAGTIEQTISGDGTTTSTVTRTS